MNQPLRSHILFLEDKLQDLKASLSGSIAYSEGEQIAAKIELVSRGLHLYRQAFEIEYALQHLKDSDIPI